VQAYSPRLNAALMFAARAHRAQLRKGTNVPYIVHPFQVALILKLHGFDEDVVIAGALHDTVEDCGCSVADIAAEFGEEVARLVAGVSETKTDDGGARRPWRVRKEEQLAHLAQADSHMAALKAADSLQNCASTVSDLQAHGPGFWDRFNAGATDLVWYYQEVARLVGARLGDHPLARELKESVAELSARAAL
jgi:(p)ppGpp synthase/HD superfamily hydrolase